MSVESDLYDAILTSIATLFPTKTRIPNPYSLKDNNEQFLVNGVGLKVGPSAFEPFEWNSLTLKRRFIVVMTVECIRLDSDALPGDDSSKTLMDDIKAVQKLLYAMDQNSGNSVTVNKVDIESASAIETVAEKTNILVMEAEFNFQIQDSLT